MSRFRNVRNLSVVPRKLATSAGELRTNDPADDPNLPSLTRPEISDYMGRGVPESSTPLTGTPQNAPGIAVVPVPETSRPDQLLPGRQRIRRASLVQDGHSFGEQAVYDALWEHGKAADKESRHITVGYRHLAELARLTVNNCKANLKSLTAKLAIEEAASFTHSQARTYRVYSYTAIMQRRKQAGLTHYVKSRGVVFVDANTGANIPISEGDHHPVSRSISTSGQPDSGVPVSSIPITGTPEKAARGVPESDASGTPVSDSLLYRQKDSHLFRNTSSSFESPPEALIEGLRLLLRVTANELDNEAAAKLWCECKQRVADCTPDEIVHFSRAKSALFHNGKIKNPIGFLLFAVPKCFEGPAFLEFRKDHKQEQERARQTALDLEARAEADRQQFREQLTEILNSPKSSDTDRKLAERLLKEDSQ